MAEIEVATLSVDCGTPSKGHIRSSHQSLIRGLSATADVGPLATVRGVEAGWTRKLAQWYRLFASCSWHHDSLWSELDAEMLLAGKWTLSLNGPQVWAIEDKNGKMFWHVAEEGTGIIFPRQFLVDHKHQVWGPGDFPGGSIRFVGTSTMPAPPGHEFALLVSAWVNPRIFHKMTQERMDEITLRLSELTTQRSSEISFENLQARFPPLQPRGACGTEEANREKEARIARATERARIQALLREQKKKQKEEEQARLREEKKKKKEEENKEWLATLLKEEQQKMKEIQAAFDLDPSPENTARRARQAARLAKVEDWDREQD